MAVSNINAPGIPITVNPSNGQRGRAVSTSLRNTSSEGYNIGLRRDTREFKEIQAIKARLNEIAEGLRDSSINKKDILERIKANLNNINKFFPPYPPGSEERVKLLKSYVAFRVLIERLTIPPDTDMLEEDAAKKSLAIKKEIARVGENISLDAEGIQYLFYNVSGS